MNRIYKVIWSRVKNSYVVVSEIAGTAKKSGGVRISKNALAAALTAFLLTASVAGAVDNVIVGNTEAPNAVTDTTDSTVVGIDNEVSKEKDDVIVGKKNTIKDSEDVRVVGKGNTVTNSDRLRALRNIQLLPSRNVLPAQHVLLERDSLFGMRTFRPFIQRGQQRMEHLFIGGLHTFHRKQLPPV